MKSIIIAFSLVAIAYVLSERCDHLDDCASTQCATNASHIECEHHQCTCIANPMSCSDRQDCTMLGRCPERHEEFHCLDGVCRCLRV
ncbi:serine protease inhibitor Cvsi-2-like [Saccostrea cucullata]|uniref:serine protease inhibitor Cvsi-2-like n=1 Tax=Saccostrea cuccullata TaxID=36930 RepID=UPI002ED28CF1